MKQNELKENASIWDNIYTGGQMMQYPDDLFMRLLYHFIKPQQGSHVLDYGFGSGATTLHLAKMGCNVRGIEVSKKAIDLTQKRIANEGLDAQFQLFTGGKLPYEDDSFDSIIAWQALIYNTSESFISIIEEFHRCLKPNGKFLAILSAPNDHIDKHSTPLSGVEKEMHIGNQNNAKIVIPTEQQLRELYFKDKEINIGVHETDLEKMGLPRTRYWVVTYEK